MDRRGRRHLAVAGVASVFAAIVCDGRAGPGANTTSAGVYTGAQAMRGKDIYLSRCTSCHNLASHTGLTFAKFWAGHRLSEMYEYIGLRMPKNDPGSLTEEETADVMAYLLKLNGMPEGRSVLPADSLALDKIRIDVPKDTK